MGNEPCTLLIASQSVHVGLLQLHPDPFLYELEKTALPHLLEHPGDLYEVHFGFPPCTLKGGIKARECKLEEAGDCKRDERRMHIK